MLQRQTLDTLVTDMHVCFIFMSSIILVESTNIIMYTRTQHVLYSQCTQKMHGNPI